MDDFLVATVTLEHHLDILKQVFKLLVDNKLELKIDKCTFLQIEYLRYCISEQVVRPTDHGIEAVINFPIPQNVHQVQSFLGLCSYFRKFVEGFSIIAKPLYDLLRKDTKFQFGK